jgi:hypothetical protein
MLKEYFTFDSDKPGHWHAHPKIFACGAIFIIEIRPAHPILANELSSILGAAFLNIDSDKLNRGIHLCKKVAKKWNLFSTWVTPRTPHVNYRWTFYGINGNSDRSI